MYDKLQPEKPVDSGFATRVERDLQGYRVLEMTGRDAVAFAQAQCMNEVAGLPVGHWQWNGWLTPKGRVVALFALIKLADDVLWLLLPDADPGELASKLKRYVFRSKVTLEPREDCMVSGTFAAPAQARGAVFQHSLMIDAETVELDFSGEGGARTLRIDARNEVGYDTGTSAATADALRWSAFDIQHGLPRLGPEQAEQWTPQMLSLQRLHAFSVKKGCYPGQEIVARTHFLGQSKRGLALLETEVPVVAGCEVTDGDRTLGSVVSVASNGNRHLALAVLPLERDGALRIDNVPAHEIPLLDGLAR